MSWRTLLFMPCARRILRTYIDCAQQLITVETCSLTDTRLFIVTSRTLSEVTRVIVAIGLDNWTSRFLVLSVKIISTVFDRFRVRLLALAQDSMLLISAVLFSCWRYWLVWWGTYRQHTCKTHFQVKPVQLQRHWQHITTPVRQQTLE